MESSTAGVMVFLFGASVWVGSWMTYKATVQRFRDESWATGMFWSWIFIVTVATFIGSVAFWAQP